MSQEINYHNNVTVAFVILGCHLALKIYTNESTLLSKLHEKVRAFNIEFIRYKSQILEINSTV